MNLKQLINKSIYGTVGYISSQNDLNILEQYILYNLPVLKEFKQIIIATNYSDLSLVEKNTQLWKQYFNKCIIIDSKINRGHNFGTADLDNLIFDWCKENREEWLCKSANDVLFQESILNKHIEEADFYYTNGISYEDLCLFNFNYDKVLNDHFYPQTNFYFINVSKCDYLNNKEYINTTFEQIKNISNYNGKVWEYINGWSCEEFLKKCTKRNNLIKHYLLDKNKHDQLCEIVTTYKIGDPSHKNLMIDGICHFQFPEQQILEI